MFIVLLLFFKLLYMCPDSFIFVRVLIGTMKSNEITEVVYYKTPVSNRRAKRFECSGSGEGLLWWGQVGSPQARQQSRGRVETRPLIGT